MPIAWLSSDKSSLARLGKIKKGLPKPKSGPGQDTDYFRFESQRQDVLQAIANIYGGTPKELNIWLLHPEVEDNFDPWMLEYTASSLKRKCDGEFQRVWLEGEKMKSEAAGNAPLPCVRETTGCQCKQTAHLNVMIAELFDQGITGYFALETHSINDIIGIQENLNAIYRLRGNLCGIPMILRRETRSISTPRGENRARVDKSLISVEPDPEWVQSRLRQIHQESLGYSAAPSAPAFHAGASPGYLLPAHHASEAASSGLPVAGRSPTPRPRSQRPVPVTDMESAENGAIVKARLESLLAICGVPNEAARRIRLGLHGDRSLATYTAEDVAVLRASLFVEWSKDLECWEHRNHAVNAWSKFVDGLELAEVEIPDQEMFDLWMQYCLDRCDAVAKAENKTIPVLAEAV